MIPKKKILISIDWFLPGTKSGGPVSSYKNLLDHFGRDHDFYIITRDTDYCETVPYTSIVPNSWNNYSENVRVYYLSLEKLKYSFIKSLYTSIEFDIILINGMYSWCFSIVPLWILKSERLKKIVSARGMLSSQAFSSKGTKKKLFLKLSKLLGLYKNVFFHATNQQEAMCIYNEIGREVPIIIAPNLPRKIGQGSLVKREKKENKVKFVSVARISKEKGTLTALRALASLKEMDSISIEYDLYGTIYDLEYWKQCLELISGLPTSIKVSYKGSINSSEVMDCLKKYHFLLMPSEGENFGHAILEALRVGRPTIISDRTPWTQLNEKKVGWDVSLKEDINLKNAVTEALEMDQKTYNKWSKASFEFAKEFCENPKLIEANKKLFN